MSKRFNYAVLMAVVLPLLCYVLCLLIVCNMQERGFNEVNIFNLQEELGLIRLFLQPIAVLSGLLAILLSPGLAWFVGFRKRTPIGLGSFIYSFLISLILIEAIIFVLRNVCSAGVDRLEFILTVFAATSFGLVFGLYRGSYWTNLRQRKWTFGEIAVFVAFILVIGLLFISMHNKIFMEDLNNDGHEVFWHSFYLTKALPYTNVPELSYLKPLLGMSFILLFGKAIASLRVPYFFYLALIYITSLAIIYDDKRVQGKVPCFILLGQSVLFTIFMFFQPYWEPYHVDLVTVVVDSSFLLLSLCLVYTLIKKEYVFTIMAIALLVQCVHYALVLLIIIMLSYWIFLKKERSFVKSLLPKIAILLSAAAALCLLHSRQFGYLQHWPEAINSEFLSRFFSAGFSISPLNFLAKYSLLVGGIPALMIFLLWRKDEIGNFVNLTALLYFLILLLIADKTVRTLMPIAFFPAIGFLRLPYFVDKNKPWLRSLKLAHSLSLTICIILLWPLSYQPHTERRNFWSKTQFIYPNDIGYIDDYVEDKIRHIFFQKNLSHIFSGTWEIYSHISDSPSCDYDYYFTNRSKILDLSDKNLKIFSSYNGVDFLVRDLSSIKQWREKTIQTAEERYANFFKLLQEKFSRKIN